MPDTITTIEESHHDEPQREAAESPAPIVTLGFEQLVGLIFFEDERIPFIALQAMVSDWSSYLALKETILLWPQAPAPIRAKTVRAELAALCAGDSQSPRDRAIRRLAEIVAPLSLCDEADHAAAIDEKRFRDSRRKRRRFDFQ